MADDIDIEEHDVLDHPRVQEMLPNLDLDLSDIKTEAPDVDIQGAFLEHPLEDFNYKEDHHSNIDENFSGISLRFEDEMDYSPVNNKIILGNKPCPSTTRLDNPILSNLLGHKSSPDPASLIFGINLYQTIKTEPSELSDDYMDIETNHSHSPVIILGSKPNPVSNIYDRNTYDHDVFDAVVLLEDWGPKLVNNPCYCNECEILFPTRNSLDAHKMSVHSFLVALDCNRAVKSTAKVATHNTARKSTVNEPSTSKGKFCNHCNKTFTDDTALIKHLYEILTSDKLKCDKCDATFAKQQELNAHTQSHHNEMSESGDSSDYYRCPICHCQYKYKTGYDRHVLNNHSLKDLKYTTNPFNHQCPICGTVLKVLKNFNRHIHEVHNYLFNKKVKSMPTTVALHTAKFPQKVVPQSKFSKKPIPGTSFQQNPVLQAKLQIGPKPPLHKTCDSSYAVYKSVSKPPVPKEILFKCNQCQIHFTNCSVAAIHSRNCLQYKGDWKCQKCRRGFKMSDKTIHQRQHCISDRFDVYVINDTLYGAVLCQCPDCKLYLHEKEFWLHCKIECRTTESVDCKVCDLPIHASVIDVHNQWHRDLEITRNDFILVEYVNVDNLQEGPEKRVAESDFEGSPTKKFKHNESIKTDLRASSLVVYYCTNCNSCMRGRMSMNSHVSGKCKNSKLQDSICKICGLNFLSRKHADFHEFNRAAKLGDLKFIRLIDQMATGPPFPQYPKCPKCSVHFISAIALQKHECNDNYKTCRYCEKRFSDLAYKLHVPLHEYGMKEPVKIPKKPIAGLSNAPQTTQDLPELLQKYQQLNKTWNILYLCKYCDILCDTYDKMVEHSQNHYSNMESYDMTVKKCHICDLKFDGSCFDKHRELHSTNETLNQDSFDILMYDYTTLLTDEWFKLFEKLPKSHIQQIVSHSIYSYARNVKMRVIADGRSEYTLFQCARCEKYINPLTLSVHHKFALCSKNERTYSCKVCHIPFASYSGCVKHSALHKPGSNMSFKRVLINEKGDEDFNNALRTDSDENTANKARNKKHFNVRGGSRYHYYKCERCECCVSGKTYKHTCNVAMKKRCPKCLLFFATTVIPKHNKLHENLPKFNRQNIKITLFKPKKYAQYQNNDERVFKIYKCTCGLHFTSSNTLETHLNVCSLSNMISKENCSKCGLLFPTDVLVSHLCSHHSNDMKSRFKVEEITKDERKHKAKCVYKCSKCNIYYMSHSSLRYHYDSNHETGTIHPCNICGLRFTKYSLRRHVDYHHIKSKCQLKDLIIKAFSPDEYVKRDTGHNKVPVYNLTKKFLSSIDLKKCSKILYKCFSCDMHFLTNKTLYSHKKNTCSKSRTNDTSVSSKCNVCGLLFGYQTIRKHQYIHHQKMKLSRNDFHISNDRCQQSITTNRQSTTMNLKSSKGPRFVTKKVGKTMISLSKSKGNGYSKNIYRCGQCDVHFITKGSLSGHLSDHKVHKTKVSCEVCALTFSENSLNRHMHIHHEVMKLTRNDFNIITGNETKIVPKIGNRTIKLSTKVMTNLRGRVNEYLYKCVQCDVHYVLRTSLKAHVNLGEHYIENKILCDECGFNFTRNSLSRHKYIHHKIMKLQPHEFVITTKFNLRDLDQDSGTEDEEMSVQESDDSEDRTTETPKLVKRNESQAAPDSVEGDTLKDSSEDEMSGYISSKDVSYEQSNELYHLLFQCDECSSHFLSFASLESHLSRRVHDNEKIKCGMCDLTFNSVITVSKHKEMHHDKRNVKLEDMTIIHSNDFPSKDVETTSTSRKLYKCKRCSVHFMTLRTFIKHASNNDNCKLLVTTRCGECDLVFSNYSITNHVRTHHEKMKLKLKDFCILNDFGKCSNIGDSNATTNDSTHVKREYILSEQIENHLLEGETSSNIKENVLNDVNSADERNTPENDNLDKIESHVEDSSSMDIHGFSETTYLNLNIAPKPLENDSGLKFDTISGNTLSLVLYDRTLYKCTLCLSHFLSESTVSSHLRRSCSGLKTSCDECGLQFFYTLLPKHKEVHHQKMKLKLQDFRIVEFMLVDGSPSNNSLYKCSACLLHFMKRHTFEEHLCTPNISSDEAKIARCRKCGYAFKVAALARHKDIHHNKMKLKRNEFQIMVCHKYKASETVVEEADRELSIRFETDKSSTKSYTEFNYSDEYKSTIDISLYDDYLYKCSRCGLHFMTRESLIRHGHRCLHPSEPVSKTDCTTCGLSFSAVSLARHKYVQHMILKIRDFHVLDDSEVVTSGDESNDDTTVNMVVDEASATSSKLYITDTSEIAEVVKKNKIIHKKKKRGRSLCMKLSENFLKNLDMSLYSNRLYKCNICKLHFLRNLTAAKHDHDPVNKKACPTCGLLFTQNTLLRHIYVQHEKLKLNLEDIEIVYYQTGSIIKSAIVTEKSQHSTANSDTPTSGMDGSEIEVSAPETDCSTPNVECDDSNISTLENSSVVEECTENVSKPKKIRAYTLSSYSKNGINLKLFNKYVYKCGTCSLHYLNYDSIKKHEYECNDSISNKVECDTCGLEFAFITLAKHKYIHHIKKKLTKQDIEVIEREPVGNTSKLNKRQTQSPSENISVSVDEDCGITQSGTNNIEAITIDEGDDEPKAKVNRITLQDRDTLNNKLYKCSKCYVHFFNYGTLDAHMLNSSHKPLKNNCSICGLSFNLTSLATHVAIHHEKLNLKLEDFEVICNNDDDVDSSIDENSSQEDGVDGKKDLKLYKCGECNVYFLTQTTCYKHTAKHTKLDTKDYIECKLCGFQFRIVTLHKHIQTHHTTDFKLDNVLIEEYQPNVLSNGTPKIDIYYAKDKVQSRLITTTSEVNSKEVDTTESENISPSNDDSHKDEETECELATGDPKNKEDITDFRESKEGNQTTENVEHFCNTKEDNQISEVEEVITEPCNTLDDNQITKNENLTDSCHIELDIQTYKNTKEDNQYTKNNESIINFCISKEDSIKEDIIDSQNTNRDNEILIIENIADSNNSKENNQILKYEDGTTESINQEQTIEILTNVDDLT